MINLKFKQISNILAILAALSISAFSNSSIAAKKDAGKVFGDWKVECTKDQKTKKNFCVAQQTLSVEQEVETDKKKKEKKQIPVATYQLFYKNKELRMLQILPQGILLEPGTSLIVDKKVKTKSSFTICQNAACFAAGKLDDKEKKALLSGKDIFIAMFNSEGKQVNLKVSNNGLKKALEALKK